MTGTTSGLYTIKISYGAGYAVIGHFSGIDVVESGLSAAGKIKSLLSAEAPSTAEIYPFLDYSVGLALPPPPSVQHVFVMVKRKHQLCYFGKVQFGISCC